MALNNAHTFSVPGASSICWLKGNDGIVKSFAAGSKNRRQNVLEIYNRHSSLPNTTTSVDGNITCIGSVFVGPDESWRILSGTSTGHVACHFAVENRIGTEWVIEMPGPPTAMALSSDNSQACVGCANGSIATVALDRAAVKARVTSMRECGDVGAVNAIGYWEQQVVTAGHSVQVWDTATMGDGRPAMVLQSSLLEPYYSVSTSTRRPLVAAGTSGGLTIWDLRNTSTPYMFALAGAHTSPGPVWSLAFSDRLDHELFATTNNALYHLAWPHKATLQSDPEIRPLASNCAPITSMAFSGQDLVFASESGQVTTATV